MKKEKQTRERPTQGRSATFIITLTIRATTRSGYVISCDVIGPYRNQNIDLTAKGLSSTEMSQQRALWLGFSLKKIKVTACNTKPINRDDFMRLSVRFTNIKMIMIEDTSRRSKEPGSDLPSCFSAWAPFCKCGWRHHISRSGCGPDWLMAVSTLETDYSCETGYPFDDSPCQIGSTS